MAQPPLSPRSESFRHSHGELLALMDTMKQQLVPSNLQRDAKTARSLLSELAGKLTIHLAMEDDALYPRLAAHRIPAVRQVTEQLRTEMGGLCGAFKMYLQHWPTAESIQMNAVRFVSETHTIFEALHTRISKEEVHIFPRLDED